MDADGIRAEVERRQRRALELGIIPVVLQLYHESIVRYADWAKLEHMRELVLPEVTPGDSPDRGNVRIVYNAKQYSFRYKDKMFFVVQPLGIHEHDMGKALKARVTGEHYTDLQLWHTATYLLSIGVRRQKGKFHPLLAASVFAFFAFEAYLNEVGRQLDPDVWRREREFFTKANAKVPWENSSTSRARLGMYTPQALDPFRRCVRTRKSVTYSRTVVSRLWTSGRT